MAMSIPRGSPWRAAAFPLFAAALVLIVAATALAPRVMRGRRGLGA
jgi:hypothetical protein